MADIHKIRWKGIELGLGLQLDGVTVILCMAGCVTQHLFNSNSFATPAAVAEVCTLLSAILVAIIIIIVVNSCCCR